MKFCLCLLAAIVAAKCGAAEASYVLENDSLARCLSISNGILRTREIVNKRAHVTTVPAVAPEFRLRLALRSEERRVGKECGSWWAPLRCDGTTSSTVLSRPVLRPPAWRSH